jgi:hypothetical protein
MKIFSLKFKKIVIVAGVIVFAAALGYSLSLTSIAFSNNSNISSTPIFHNYQTEWVSSDTEVENDPYRSMLTLLPVTITPQGGHRQGSSFADINGDGLVDLLFFNQGTSFRNNVNIGWRQLSAVLINNGKGFNVVYKCAIHNDNESQFYGDCAAQ